MARLSFADLFGNKDTLVVYNYMYGPQREQPCPMCTSLLSAWDGEVPDIQQRVAFAVIARSPIERLVAFKRARGWHYLPLYSDATGEFSRDYHAITKDGGDDAAFNVFTRRDGTIRHFWGGEMGFASADPGQDPRGAPDLMPIWTILDATPEGRGKDSADRRQAGGRGLVQRELAGQDQGDADDSQGEREDEPAGAACVQRDRLTASARRLPSPSPPGASPAGCRGRRQAGSRRPR